MIFLLPHVFVSPVGNTLPTTGTTSDLTANQLGIFLPNFTPATAGNAAAAEYLRVVQQRPNSDLNLPTVKSDKIYADKVIKKYKIVGSAGDVLEATISDFDVRCDENLSLTLRVWENDLEISYANGYTRTFTKKAPCCDCDGDPCESVSTEDLETLIAEFVDDINGDPILSKYMTASVGSDDVSIDLVGINQVDAPVSDKLANTYRPNATSFKAWAYRGAPTTQDIIDYDSCEAIGTFTITQEIGYPVGTSQQVEMIERSKHSYKIPIFKDYYKGGDAFNGLYHSNVTAGTLYDQLVIEFYNPETPVGWNSQVAQTSVVQIFTPQAQTSAVEAILTPKYGTFPVI